MSREITAAVPLVDVTRAFQHVPMGNLINGMEELGFEADLVRWVESYMKEEKIIISMDRREGNRKKV